MTHSPLQSAGWLNHQANVAAQVANPKQTVKMILLKMNHAIICYVLGHIVRGLKHLTLY